MEVLGVSSVNSYSFRGVNASAQKIPQSSAVASNPNSVTNPALSKDTFVSTIDKKQLQIDKLNKLFPDGGIEKVYQDINKDFEIDYQPELKLAGDNDKVVGGGYLFYRNEISMSLSDLADSDTKIVGIKDGKRTVLTSPKNGLPLFINSKLAQVSAYMLSKNGSLGYDKLIVEPVTPEEQRQFVVQKLAHEVIHAQQHMIMRQTEGIGEKEILKAWMHAKPKNMVEEGILRYTVDKMYNSSFWSNKPETTKTVENGSIKGNLAKIWLESVRNYPPVDSPEYEKTAIEVDAYIRSAKYAADKYGQY